MRHAVLATTATLMGGLLAVAPAPSLLVAQTAPTSACAIDQNSPKELALAWLSLTRAQSLAAGPARETILRQLMKDLVDKPEKFASNPGGYQYVLTTLYTMMATQPNGAGPTTRGAVGLTTRPGEPFDVVVELNDAFTKMEAAAPSCKNDIAQSRNNDAWAAITRRAFDESNGGNADSAVFYAKRSLILSPNNPFAHHILATVAQSKNDLPGAMAEWRDVIRLSGSDTSYRDIKSTSQFYLGVNELQQAATKTGDAQKTQARAAAGYLRDFLTLQPAGPDAPTVMNNLSQALLMAGDTAQAKTIYTDLVTSPDKYSEAILTMGGVIATQANDTQSALKLFQSAVNMNSRSRDGLRNLAATYYGRDEYDKMFTPLHQLIELDPNNYDAWMMFAYAAQGLGKAAKTPADKKAWTDTLIKYNTMADKLPAKVDVVAFTRGAASSEVTLAVEQMADASGTYNITMEFLDKGGSVVATDTKSTGALTKGKKQSVVFKGAGAGIVAFRYKPLA